MADDTNTAERESFEAHYRRCGANDATLSRWVDDGSTPPAMVGKYIIRSVQDAWLAFQAGRASLAASAGSEPVALTVYSLQWPEDVESGRINLSTMFDTEAEAKNYAERCRDPETIRVVTLYTHPSPLEGMAGWKLVPIEPTLDMGWAYLDAARESEPLRTHSFNHAGYRAMIAATPPIPASEAKEAGQ